MGYNTLQSYRTVSDIVISLGDRLRFAPDAPCIITRWGVMQTAAITGASQILALDLQEVIGSGASRIDAWGGQITAAAGATGRCFQHTLDGSYAGEVAIPSWASSYSRPRGLIVAGETAVIQCTQIAGGGGTGHLFIEYEPLGAQGIYHYDPSELPGAFGKFIETAS